MHPAGQVGERAGGRLGVNMQGWADNILVV